MSFQKNDVKDFYNIFYKSIKVERILVLVTYSNRKPPSLTFFRPSLKSMIGPPVDIFFAYQHTYTAAGFSLQGYR
jgi:hypothetical protein